MTALDFVLLSIGIPAFYHAFAPQKVRFWERKTQQHDESISEPSVSDSIQTPEVPSAPSQPVDISLEVTPRGGDGVSLEIRPSVTGEYYGYGWISGAGVKRSASFELAWKDYVPRKMTIRGGDIKLILIADYSAKTRSKLTVWSAKNKIAHTDSSWGWWSLERTHTEWINLRIEIRSDKFDGSWKREYRFRLSRNEGFEVEEVRDHNLDTTESKLGRSSYLLDLDRKILLLIADLEKEDRAITPRSVWGRLTDYSVEKICERLVLLERTGYISAQIGPKEYVGGTTSTVRDGDIHGLTEKGRAAITRKVQG